MPATATIVKAAVLALALSIVGVLMALNFTDLRLLGEQGGHEHGGVTQGSPAYNGANVSFLESGGGYPDSILTVCDRERDGYGAGARAYHRASGDFTYAYDNSGSNDGDCDTEVTRRNHAWHETSRRGSYAGTQTSLHR